MVAPSNPTHVAATSPGCAIRPMARPGSPSRGSAASPTTFSGVAYARWQPPGPKGTMRLRGPPYVGPSTVRVHVRLCTSMVRILNESSATNSVGAPPPLPLRGRNARAVETAPPPAAGPPSATSLVPSSFTPPSTEEPKTSKRHRRPSSPHDTSSSAPPGPAWNAKPETRDAPECARCLPRNSNARDASSPSGGAEMAPCSLNRLTHPPASAAAAYEHSASSDTTTRVTLCGVNRITCTSTRVLGSSAFSAPPAVPTSTPAPSLR
mmetsp:Transcript_14832/g.35800  ORF Transcript_14832/g.35800 Transcript_14832/m.35800 type:complete len:265 (+) Transcript_14832:1075-1869(+)